MRPFIASFIFSAISLVSFSQEDRGCGISSSYYVMYGETASGYSDIFLSCYGMYSIACPTSKDTILIELNQDADVLMRWTFKDELDMGFPHASASTIEWYKNDTLLASDEFSFYDYIDNGACGPRHKAGSSLRTQAPGAYQLRRTSTDVYTPVIFLLPKAAEITDSEHLALKIYPNPANDVLFIDHGDITSAEVILHSIDGKLIVHPDLTISGSTTNVDISNLPRGSYILTFSSDQHDPVRERINKM